MGGEASEAAAQILVEHRNVSHFGQCACGWKGNPREEHAAHVIHELQMAGLDVVWR